MKTQEQFIQELLKQSDKVFFYCIKRCDNRIDAEDLSQEILLEVLMNIHKGILIQNFDFYLWKICKNHYQQYVTRKIKEKNTIQYRDEIYESYDAIDDFDMQEQMRKLNTAIKCLSSDYAEILYSYYIEDRTLASIANHLNLPLGTVKRRLFEIRKKLKEYLKMERLNGKKAFVPKNFYGLRSGYGEINPHDYTRFLIQKNLLFHSYDHPCTLQDYSLELGISIVYIEEMVLDLLKATLLKKENNKYLTAFPIIEKATDIKLTKILEDEGMSYATQLAMFAKNHFQQFKEIIQNHHFTDHQLMWVLMFMLNRFVESNNGILIDNYKPQARNHVDKLGSWDFMMIEDYPNTNKYFISENWFGNEKNQFQGVAHPGSFDHSDNKLLNTISYPHCVTGDNIPLDSIEYVISNPHVNYSKISGDSKYRIDEFINQGYAYLEEDQVQLNFLLLDKSQVKQIDAYFPNHKELKLVKQEKERIIDQLTRVLNDAIPTYLSHEIPSIAHYYFISLIRKYVVLAFGDLELIKEENTDQRFNFNMYAWKV